MNNFLTRRIPTFFGYLIILLIAGAFGAVIFVKLYQLMTTRFEVGEFEVIEKPAETNSTENY